MKETWFNELLACQFYVTYRHAMVAYIKEGRTWDGDFCGNFGHFFNGYDLQI